MNLKLHLLAHISLVAIICLFSTSIYVLYREDQQAKQQSQVILNSIARQLEVQLMRIDAGYEHPDHFPDLSLWKETRSVPGVCIRIKSKNNEITRSVCRGTEWSNKQWPKLFEIIYRFVFTPELKVFRQISFKNQIQGSVSVITSAEMQLSQAWKSIRALLELSSITILAVSLLIYFFISRALRPAQFIVSGLEKMQKGDLSVRLADFELLEWQRTSAAINELAITQQQLLSDRKKLTFKLITLQNEERRYLARELHDELGQCLAATSALASSITQTAKQECPAIVQDAESLSKINNHIMETVRNLLTKLRPVEVDELGLELSLKNLVNEWNRHSAGKTYCQLFIKGSCQQLTDPYPITLFRIIQECLSNISKHSDASRVTVTLDVNNESITLSINDNGNIDALPFVDDSGFGMLGIEERVSSLAGQLQLYKNDYGGLTTNITLPINFNESSL